MLALLRLDATLFLRGWRNIAWPTLVIGLPILFIITLDRKADTDDLPVTMAWISGVTVFFGLIGWFLLIAQIEGLVALAPLPPRRRAAHHLVLAGLLTLPAAVFAGATAGPLMGLAVGLLTLSGIVLFCLVCLLTVRLPSFLQLLLAALIFFGAPVAVGFHYYFGRDPAWLAAFGALAGGLVAAYLALFRGLEFSVTQTLRLRHEPEPRPDAPARNGAVDRPLARRSSRPSPLWILFRVAYLRWYVLVLAPVAVVLGFSPNGGGLSQCLLLFITIMWPIHVWKAFQASPLPRTAAFLTLFGPLFLLWVAAFGAGAVGFVLERDVRFVGQNAEGQAYLKVPGGWLPTKEARAAAPAGPLAVDPQDAARQIQAYLETVFGLRVPTDDLLALRAGEGGPATLPWIRSIEDRFGPEIRRRAVWSGVLLSLVRLAVVFFLSGIYLLPSSYRAVYSLLYWAAILGVAALPLIEESGVERALLPLRDAALAQPAAFATAAALVCLAFAVRHFFAFRRLEQGNLAWNVTSGGRTP